MVRNPFHGWQPVQIEDPAAAKRISERYVNQSIAELEDLTRGTTDGDSTLQMFFSPELLNHWRNEEFMQLGLVPALIVSRTAICGIVDRVRNAVLDWSLQLEEQGVLGDGMTFTSTEKQNAGAVVYNIQNVTGVVGGSITADNLQIMSFSSIHAELKQLGIGQEGRNELERIMDALPAASPEEKPSLLQAGLDWIGRNKEALGALNAMLVAWFKGFSCNIRSSLVAGETRNAEDSIGRDVCLNMPKSPCVPDVRCLAHRWTLVMPGLQPRDT